MRSSCFSLFEISSEGRMRFQLLVFLLMTASFCAISGQAMSYEDCCLSYNVVKHPKKLSRKIIHHRVQGTGGGCNLPAIVLTLKKSRIVCVDPEEKWLQMFLKKSRKWQKETRTRSKKLSDSKLSED
uniref:C-C motif chemokine 25 n=2 Tax=Callorhinchus milii TaxID=7868 RepID=K4G0A6_CALMI|nr:C-C motif chemokine 25 precursor [Callorhinchus milii]